MVKKSNCHEYMLGFIITRKIINNNTSHYWKEACSCIRRFYPENPILIVDDNSNKQWLTEENPFPNCSIVTNTDYPGAGELAGYYYFHKLRPFEKAVVIHDSIFFQTYVDFSSVEDIQFLWYFPQQFNLCVPFHNHLPYSTLSPEEKTMSNSFDTWLSCFGVMSVVTWDFIHRLDEKTGLLRTIIPHVTDRTTREYCERLYGFFCHLAKPSLLQNPALLGDIFKYCTWGLSWEGYLAGWNRHLPIVKVWTGR